MENFRLYTVLTCLTLFTVFEWFFPYFEKNQHGKALHDLKNYIVAGVNGVLGAFLYVLLTITAMEYSEEYRIGLTHWVSMPEVVHLIFVFLLFDCWMYWWHRLNHEVPFLWRFHRMHHTDTKMNTSTGLRFHPGEIVLSFVARFFIIVLIGMRAEELILYEAVLFAVVLFHHSNVRITAQFDDALRLIFVSPNMHKVHHSEVVSETNSNYSSVFSFWDRIFGSFIHREDPENIQYGIGVSQDERFEGLVGMLRTPFLSQQENRDSGSSD